MQSLARERLRVVFSDLKIGQRFHMVNSVMAGAIPGTPTYERIADEFESESYLLYNARRVDIDLKVRIRPNSVVELCD